jgi:hypothetical protein
MALGSQSMQVETEGHQLLWKVVGLALALALAASLAGFMTTRHKGVPSSPGPVRIAPAVTSDQAGWLEIGNLPPIRIGGTTYQAPLISRSCSPQIAYSCKPLGR